MSGPWEAVVIGCSSGGLKALQAVLGPLPADFPLPILVVSHTAPGTDGLLAEVLAHPLRLAVAEAEDKGKIHTARVHLAPPDYHLFVERDRTLSLSVDPRVCNVRPAIDLLFQTAATVFRDRLIGVLLTGANQDGAEGLKAIRQAGGLAIVQDPATAEARTMPEAAIATAGADYILPLDAIAAMLTSLSEGGAR